MRRLVLALAAALLAGAAQAQSLRIGTVAPAGGACAPAKARGGEKAYYDHLAQRLGREVLVCPFASPAAAASALAQGQIDLTRLDPAAFAPVRGQTRAILTVRAASEANRIPIVVAVRGSDPARDLLALKGRLFAFGGRSPAGLATPRAVLAERGLASGAYREQIEVDGDDALAKLRARQVDAAAVHAAAWQRVCRKVSPKEPNPCNDLHVVIRARPRAAQAIVVRRDMPDEIRYRLIGVHTPLHLEAPAAFAFATNWVKGAAEFQPAEADALTLATLK